MWTTSTGARHRQFQSTPSGGKATRQRARWSRRVGRVSIHAFRGEGDAWQRVYGCRGVCFNPRLPGGRRHVGPLPRSRSGLVSIHAFRGEGDSSGRPMVRLYVDVSIHAFRGEGDGVGVGEDWARAVSIHAFRGEGDSIVTSGRCTLRCFNPRLPGGRRLGDNLRPRA